MLLRKCSSVTGFQTGKSIGVASIAAIMCCLLATSIASAQQTTPAAATVEQHSRTHSVAGSIDSFRLRDGYRIRLIASEPLVVDPVSARMDRRGRLWVVEMPDYPTGPRDGSAPAGRIRVLSDANGDGDFETAVTFADGLMFATGVLPYGDGAIVTVAGEILHLVDSNNDGRSDQRTVLFRGFAVDNEQLRANHPILGPDGWVYVAGGLRGGSIEAVADRYTTTGGPVNLSSSDFAFDPRGSGWAAVPGRSQHGLTIDDFGRRFGCSNRNPAISPMLSFASLANTTELTRRDVVADVSKPADTSLVRPISRAWTTSHLHRGQFSAACGVLASGHSADDDEWLYVCEPTGSLVQRQRLNRVAGHWHADRESTETEFLASSDDWFRPVDCVDGPGGSLLVVDMARAVIEHPDWAPDELKNRPDTWLGNDLGRIWKIIPIDATYDASVQLTVDSIDEAISALNSPVPATRQSGSAYLFTMDADSVELRLRRLIHNASASPRAVSRAADALRYFGRLTHEDVDGLWSRQDPRLREKFPEWAPDATERLCSLTAGEDQAAVLTATQALIESGQNNEQVIEAFTAASAKFGDDLWIRRSLLCCDATQLLPLCQRLFATEAELPARPELKRALLRRLAGADATAAAVIVAKQLRNNQPNTDNQSLRFDSIDAWSAGAGSTPPRLTAAMSKLDPELQSTLESEFQRAAKLVLEAELPSQQRVQCIELLKRSGGHGIDVEQLLDVAGDYTLRSACVDLAFAIAPTRVRELLDARLEQYSPRLLGFVCQRCSTSQVNAIWILQKLQSGSVPKSVVSPRLAGQLMASKDTAVRKAAKLVFATDPDRQRILQQYSSAATDLGGDRIAGQALFKTHCSQCHKIDGIGTNVGPDISDSRQKTPQSLLVAVLDPDAAIDADYVRCIVQTVDGRIEDGILLDQTSTTLTLGKPEGKKVQLALQDIEARRVSKNSLMPSGFERVLSVNQMRDLLTYLKHWRYDASGPPLAQ